MHPQASSVAPFLRSLSTALSLRFPLHTSGDPYASPSNALSLSAVVNCLSLNRATDSLCPVEGYENDEVRRSVGERVATTVGVVKGIMPIMRTAASRPGQPEGVFLSLCKPGFQTLSRYPLTQALYSRWSCSPRHDRQRRFALPRPRIGGRCGHHLAAALVAARTGLYTRVKRSRPDSRNGLL